MLTIQNLKAYIQSLEKLKETDSFKEITNKISSLKWNLLLKNGSNVYIFESPCENFVLRVENFYFTQNHHLHIKNALKHQHNEFMPKIYWFKTLDTVQHGISFTLMEYLDELEEESVNNNCFYKSLTNAFPDGSDNIYISDDIRNNFPELADALEILKEPFERNSNISSDICQQNIMQRPCGQLVITDPYT